MRLSVTYLLVAAAVLWLTHRRIRRLRLGAALFLALLPAAFLGEAFAKDGVWAPLDIVYRWEPFASIRPRYGFGKPRTPLLVDVVDQHIPWRKAVREAIKNGRWPLWNRFQLGGEPLLAVQMPAVLWPGTWLGLALPLAQAWTFDMAVRVLLALLGAYLFLRELECGEVAACFGATAWAFCDFLVFAAGYPHGAAAGALAWLVLGLHRIARTHGERGGGLTIGATALILSAGHPETALHCIAAAGLFFLITVLSQPSGFRAREIGKALVCGLLGAALMAVTLVPFFEILPHTFEYALRSGIFAATPKSIPFFESLLHLGNQIVPYSEGLSGKSLLAGYSEASSYGGSLVLIFAVVGLAAGGRSRLALATVGAVGILTGAGMPGVANLVGTLPLFDIALNGRLLFVGAFALAMLAGLGLDAVLRGGLRRWTVGAAIGTSVVVLGVWIARRPAMLALKMDDGYMRWRLALQLLPAAGVLAAALLPGAGRRTARAVWSVPVLLAVLRYLEIGRLYPVASSDAFYPPLQVLRPIVRDAPQRFAALFLTFIPNTAALYELEDVRAYDALTLKRLVETYPLWCVPQAVWFNRIDDPTRPFLSFLNVRYVLAPPDYGVPPGFHVAAIDAGGKLLENERVLPRAFLPRRILCQDRAQEDVSAMRAIEDFADAGVAPLGCAEPRWTANGRASAQIASYGADSLDVAIDAQEPTLLATSIPAWPGWRVRIDGRTVSPVFYNHAFWSVRVEPGRHLVRFRYLPTGFLLGAGITACAAIGLILGWTKMHKHWSEAGSPSDVSA